MTIFPLVRHVYVHVPFCRRRCVYCDFAIAVRRTVPADEYVHTVLAELDRRFATESRSVALETLYLGGGTPSLLPPQAIADLLDGLRSRLFRGQPSVRELTLEANPDDVTPQAARTWAAAGVNRVSLGAQSFDRDVLSWMHRTHDAAAIGRSVEALRGAGIRSVSLDLIFALPNDVGGDFASDLSRALELEPDHVSSYGLTVEHRTPLGRWVGRGRLQPAAEDRYEREFLLADEILTAAGFEHYEVSSYAKPGHRAIHNACYWSGESYMGLGPAAHSFCGTERRWNLRHWVAYERAVSGGQDPIGGCELLDPPRQRLEQLYLGLRTAEGIPAVLLGETAATVVGAGELQGWFQVEADRVRLTPRGWLRMDELTGVLTTSAGGG